MAVETSLLPGQWKIIYQDTEKSHSSLVFFAPVSEEQLIRQEFMRSHPGCTIVFMEHPDLPSECFYG